MAIVEECTVVSLKKGLTYIKLISNAKCEGCKACGFGRKDTQILPAYSDISCNAGDNVRVEMPQQQIRLAAAILYIIPLIAFLAGLLAGIPLGEGFMLLFAVLFMAVSFVAVYFIDKSYKKNKKYLPKIIEKINFNEGENIND